MTIARIMGVMLDQLRRFFKRPDSGERGERLAADWLRRHRGFRIVARNWRSPSDRRDEIDLVARDGEVLVFVEVKARAAGALVSGYHAVDRRKKRVVRRVVAAYLAGLRVRPDTVRFDIVEVALPPSGGCAEGIARVPEVRHFAGIPLFPRHWRP
jgi:putative endonuclease